MLWESEAERSKVLREKHERGRAARQKRKLRETDFASVNNRGTKHLKVSHRGQFQSKSITCIDTHKHVNKNATAHYQAAWFQNKELKRSIQLTNPSYTNMFLYSDHHLQEASLSFSYDRILLPNNLLPFDFEGHSHDNGQQGLNQAFSQPPDHRHYLNCKPPFSRLTDAEAKSCFPKSSFSINCTGNACTGDVVLFKQHVYLGKSKLGKKRTIAGRIVKVHKCGSKDVHKFMIRVLWVTPSLNLHQRLTLPVRSHDLYQFGTFRQPWKNEADRLKLVEDKNGPATRKQKPKKTDIASNKNKGAKRQKVSHNGRLQIKLPIQIAKHKSSKKKGANATTVKGTKAGHKKAPPAWLPPNQPAFSFPGHGGQWGPNHGFIQPPGYYDYIQLLAQSLMALLCQQQPR
ncbi:hypothetical protein E3N88_45788 [Mikania micrantha]|uniref:DUF7699 domain-containing protein n=1 Tax=Mikania micrantha TaxID=192012 RepID=A0A5N6L8C9_9ASTR|nr:hypothetical protein E3N88_45788 [Mikania micrantha]